MSRHSTIAWQNEISIRHENTRFASMFILFSLFAFLTTIFLFIFANKSYYNQSEITQRHFLPYCTLASISLVFFLIFSIGAFVYTSRSLRLRDPPIPLPRSILKSQIDKTTTRTTDAAYYQCQTDV
jgi:hypothetical protein